MKRGRLFFSLTLLVALNAAPMFADDVAIQLESIVVDSFDDLGDEFFAEGLALAVDGAVVATGEVDALEGAGLEVTDGPVGLQGGLAVGFDDEDVGGR